MNKIDILKEKLKSINFVDYFGDFKKKNEFKDVMIHIKKNFIKRNHYDPDRIEFFEISLIDTELFNNFFEKNFIKKVQSIRKLVL